MKYDSVDQTSVASLGLVCLPFQMLLRFSLLVFTTLPSVLGNGVLPGQIKNLVTFGDSYTDVVQVGDGGTAWPVYASGYAQVSLFPFARSGATCSNNITFRPFPSLFESQLPAYFSATGANPTTHAPGKLNASQTLYTLWLGTNDVGANALLTGSDGKANLVDVTQCMVNWVNVLYESGARNFLFQNVCWHILLVHLHINLRLKFSLKDDTARAHRALLA